MIRIEFEANGKTPVGYGRFWHSEYIYSDYRDIDTVEKIVKKICSFFRNKAFNDQCITLAYVNKKAESINISRYWRCYSDKFEYVIWNGVGAGTNAEFTKLENKRIREAYLACADFGKEYEWNEEGGEA